MGRAHFDNDLVYQRPSSGSCVLQDHGPHTIILKKASTRPKHWQQVQTLWIWLTITLIPDVSNTSVKRQIWWSKGDATKLSARWNSFSWRKTKLSLYIVHGPLTILLDNRRHDKLIISTSLIAKFVCHCLVQCSTVLILERKGSLVVHICIIPLTSIMTRRLI